MKILNELREIVRNPYKYGTKCKRLANKKMIGYFCSYTPEELIFVAGAHPFRIFGSSEKIQLSDSHLQSYCCSSVLESP